MEEGKRNPYAKYHVDPVIKKAGIIFEDEDNRITVTYAGNENERYTRLLKLKLKPHESRIRSDSFPDKEFQKILAEVYAATVVLNWQVNVGKDEDENIIWQDGIFDAEGTILQMNEFSIVQAFSLGERLFEDVIKVASNFNLFRQRQLEDEGKN
jgi:hypothetical protein